MIFSASYYDIRFTSNEADFSDDDLWNGLREITAEDVISGSLEPLEVGKMVTFEVSKDMFAPDDVIFLAMRSCDNLNQTSEISEPFQLIFDFEPPSPINNLKAELILDLVQISFTAPGDDYNNGTGNKSNFLFTKKSLQNNNSVRMCPIITGIHNPVFSVDQSFQLLHNRIKNSKVRVGSIGEYGPWTPLMLCLPIPDPKGSG